METNTYWTIHRSNDTHPYLYESLEDFIAAVKETMADWNPHAWGKNFDAFKWTIPADWEIKCELGSVVILDADGDEVESQDNYMTGEWSIDYVDIEETEDGKWTDEFGSLFDSREEAIEHNYSGLAVEHTSIEQQ
jgi:hypothetical protein